MAIKNNKTCLCCGEKYSYCPSCSRADSLKPSYYSDFHSETCMTLWTTLTKYNMNMLSKAEAKSIISKLDLKPIETYAECVQRDYAKVMAEDKKPRRTHKRIEPVVEMEPIIIEQPEEVAPTVEETESHEVVNKTEEEINEAL